MSNMLLGDVVSPSKIIRKGNRDVPFLSMSREEGLIINDKNNSSRDTIESSKIARYGQLVIGLHMDEGSIWVQNTIKEGAVSSAYDVMNVDLDVINPIYMNYALHTKECMQFYGIAGVGNTIRRSKVPWKTLKTMPIRVPDIEEQEISVNLIGKIESLKRRTHLALTLINDAENGLFNERVKKSSSVLIEKIANLTFGKAPQFISKSTDNDLMTFISGTSDFGEVFTRGKKKAISAKKIVEPDSVLISVREPVGKVNITSERCAIGRGLVGMTPKKGIAVSDYVYLALKNKKEELDFKAHGIIKGIGPKEVKEISVGYIDMDEQKKLSKYFQELEKIRNILQNMLTSTDILYQKVLQERFGCSVVVA